jgi:nucleotide-binding universal stress UspA family protein
MISNILVTDDATEASDKAIEKASELAEQMNVPVEDLDSSLHLSKK